jgi:hypothetical protein
LTNPLTTSPKAQARRGGERRNPSSVVVAGEGFEPSTSGL